MAILKSPAFASVVLVFVLVAGSSGRAQELPQLTQPVNDFAKVIDPSSAAAIDSLSRSLERASGDVIVVATVDSYAPYADIREYAVKLFENGGRGIGQRGRDNGLLVVLAVKEREVWVEVGYDLEQFITDGYAGETSRLYMAPEFRRGQYGCCLPCSSSSSRSTHSWGGPGGVVGSAATGADQPAGTAASARSAEDSAG